MMFSRFCRRNSCDKVPGDLAEQKVQESVDTVVQHCDGKRSTSSDSINEGEASKLQLKYLRFELDVATSNAWGLPSSMAGYQIKRMRINIPDNDIRKKN